jgi:hypothetical protein
MKESKFIELLNLYLDQQIDPADAALLEEEIARHAGRRKTYQQYCRMHRACITLFEQSRPSSDVSVKLATAAAAADEKITAFPAPWRGYAWIAYGSGLAAAACVAFVVLHRPAGVPAAQVRDEIVQIAPTKLAGAVKPAGSSNLANYQPIGLVSHSARPPLGGAVVSVSDEQPSLDWMNQVQFAPLAHASTEEIFLDPHPASRNDPRAAFQSRRPFQDAVEKAAFQFQR